MRTQYFTQPIQNGATWILKQPVELFCYMQQQTTEKVERAVETFELTKKKVAVFANLTKRSYTFLEAKLSQGSAAAYQISSDCIKGVGHLIQDAATLTNDKKFISHITTAACSSPFLYFAAKIIEKGVLFLSEYSNVSLNLSTTKITHLAASQPIFFFLATIYLLSAINLINNLHNQTDKWTKTQESTRQVEEVQQDRSCSIETILKAVDSGPNAIINLLNFFNERSKYIKERAECIQKNRSKDDESFIPPKKNSDSYARESQQKYELLIYAMQKQLLLFTQIQEEGLSKDQNTLVDYINKLEIPEVDRSFSEINDPVGEHRLESEKLQDEKEKWKKALNELYNSDSNAELDPYTTFLRVFASFQEEFTNAATKSLPFYFFYAIFSILTGKEMAVALAIQYALKQTLFTSVMAASVSSVSSATNCIFSCLKESKPSTCSRNLSTFFTFSILACL